MNKTKSVTKLTQEEIAKRGQVFARYHSLGYVDREIEIAAREEGWPSSLQTVRVWRQKAGLQSNKKPRITKEESKAKAAAKAAEKAARREKNKLVPTYPPRVEKEKPASLVIVRRVDPNEAERLAQEAAAKAGRELKPVVCSLDCRPDKTNATWSEIHEIRGTAV